MQIKLKISLPVLLVAAMLASRVFAQEGNQSNSEAQELNSHPELNLNDDKILIMDMDPKPPKVQSIAKEGTAPAAGLINAKKQEPQNKTVAAPDKTDEDLLNFNFLYFIIQKFKISDIVDDE